MSANPFDLSGRTALVTGGSRGLGRYMALALARAGADLVVTSRKAADCDGTLEEVRRLGRKGRAYGLDVRSKESIEDLGRAAARTWRRSTSSSTTPAATYASRRSR